MKKATYLLLIALLTLTTKLWSQQESHYTQFMYNKLYLNPAYAGAEGYGSFVGIYRNQWIGFEGAPVSQVVSFNTPFVGRRVGFGIVLNHDKIGIMNNFNGALSYSYSLVETENASLRIGLQGTAKYFRVDFSDPALEIDDINDPSIAANQTTNDMYWNFGTGLYLEVNNFFFGASAPKLIENVFSFNPTAGDDRAAERRHFYLMTGFSLPVSTQTSVKTAVLAKYVQHAPLDVDINLALEFQRRFSAGLSYRIGGDGFGDSVDFLVFGQINPMFGLGLAYDYTLSDLRSANSGSIEALLRVDLIQGSEKLKNPRFFF